MTENWLKVQTVQICLSRSAWLIGNTLCRILNVLILLIALSQHVFSNLQFPESLLLDPLKTVPDYRYWGKEEYYEYLLEALVGHLLQHLYQPSHCPLFQAMSEFQTVWWFPCLIMPPVYNWDTNITQPEGTIPNRALAIVHIVKKYFSPNVSLYW